MMKNIFFMTGKKTVLPIILTVLFCTIGTASAQESYPEINFAILKPGLLMYRAGIYDKAAEQWQEAAVKALADGPKKSASVLAAIAHVLATMAFESDRDARAYVSWGNSIQHFLEGDTRWPEQQLLLSQRIERLQFELRAGNSEVAFLKIDENNLTLIDLDQVLNLTAYQGPAAGLKMKVRNEGNQDVSIGRNYYGRPLGAIPDAGNDESRISRGMAGVDDSLGLSDDQNGGLRGPGFSGPRTGRLDDRSRSALPEDSLSRSVDGSGFPGIGRRTRAGDKKADGEFEDLPDNDNRVSRGIAPIQGGGRHSGLQDMPEDLPDEFVEEQGIRVPGGAQANIRFSNEDLEIARTAWRYMRNNRQINTGMYNAIQSYSYTTMWDMGSALAALVAANKLKIVDDVPFRKQMGKLLETLRLIPLYENELPNREYHTRTGRMVDYRNRESDKGSGWAAVDIGRMLIWLKIIQLWYPEYAGNVDKIVERFDFLRLSINHEMNGTRFNGRRETLVQEGRLGYEQYAAVGFSLWGHFLPNAFDYADVDSARVFGYKIPYDRRPNAYLVSDPFMLSKIEVGGIDAEFDSLIATIYAVQKERWIQYDILTAVNEDALAEKPWFVYNSIFLNSKPWNCVSHDGQSFPSLKSISTKAALGWAAIYPENYSELLRKEVVGVLHPKYGYYAGVFESGDTNKSLNINTNAIILEAMLYKKRGGRPFIMLDLEKISSKFREDSGGRPAIQR